MLLDTEDSENGHDNCGYTNSIIMLLSVSRVFPVSSVLKPRCLAADHAALIREIVRALISVKPMSVPIFSPYPSFMFSMPSGSR